MVPAFRSGARQAATPQEIRALASAARLRILRLTRDRALTNQQIAERLGLTAGSALYHVRRLVAAGLLEPQPPRPRPGGGIEIPYRSHGRSWTLHVDEADKPTSAMLAAFLDEVGEVGAERLEHAVRFRSVLTRERRRELVARIYELFDEFAESPDGAGEPWSAFFALHPDPAAGERDQPR